MTYSTLKSAVADAGRVSTGNSKMPGSSFAISATRCKVGGKLAAIEGSTCSRCYALKLQKLRPSVHMGWEANYLKATKMIAEAPEKWAQAMAFQIRKAVEKTGERYHRWFDAGDLQSVEMLKAIYMVCRLTPEIQHWLPTRETKILAAMNPFSDPLPDNLVIRASSTMVGDKPIRQYAWTSTVHRKSDTPVGHVCPASQQGNACGSCRACWDRDVPTVSYPLH